MAEEAGETSKVTFDSSAVSQPKSSGGEDRHKAFGVKQTHLSVQDVATLDVSKLTPLTPEVISRQATINIGTIGHVAHGKSTVVKAISGVQTIRFKNELVRNITIKLGYANAKIYKTDGPKDEPGNYRSKGSSTADEYVEDGKTWKLQRHVSFVDCPGHDILMATMLNGAAVMDAALLLIAGNEPCPQPQTSEHLAAVEIMRLKNIIILQVIPLVDDTIYAPSSNISNSHPSIIHPLIHLSIYPSIYSSFFIHPFTHSPIEQSGSRQTGCCRIATRSN